METKNSDKKILLEALKEIKIVIYIVLLILAYFLLRQDPVKILEKHLKKRNHKDFVIYYGGGRNDGRSSWFEAEIYPKELVGTLKEYDEYYWAKGFVENGKGGDTYGGVLLNESANEFYLPKLKELFGENVLPIFEVDGYYEKTDFQEEMARRREFYKEDPDGRFFKTNGRIYIFDRVENDKDREKYRNKIYEFINYMKETKTFEYVNLGIYIIDERILADGALEYIKSLKEIKDVNKDFKPLNEKFKNTSKESIQEKINSFPKKDIYKILNEYHGYLLSADIFTLKGMRATFNLSDKGDLEWICKYYGGIKEYEKLQDVEFEDEVAKKNIEVKKIFPGGYGIYINDKLVFKGIWDRHGKYRGELSRDENGILTYTCR